MSECKQQDKYLKLNKTYEFDILFELKTDTYDVSGKLCFTVLFNTI